MLHLFDELLSGLFSALESGPLGFDLLERCIDHHLDWPDAFLLTRVDIDIEGEVPQSHQLEHLIFNLLKLHDSFPMFTFSSFLHYFRNLSCNWPTLEDENYEALNHGVHLFHNFESCERLWSPFRIVDVSRDVDSVVVIDLDAVLTV